MPNWLLIALLSTNLVQGPCLAWACTEWAPGHAAVSSFLEQKSDHWALPGQARTRGHTQGLACWVLHISGLVMRVRATMCEEAPSQSPAPPCDLREWCSRSYRYETTGNITALSPQVEYVQVIALWGKIGGGEGVGVVKLVYTLFFFTPLFTGAHQLSHHQLRFEPGVVQESQMPVPRGPRRSWEWAQQPGRGHDG